MFFKLRKQQHPCGRCAQTAIGGRESVEGAAGSRFVQAPVGGRSPSRTVGNEAAVHRRVTVHRAPNSLDRGSLLNNNA